jgi:hypothetical protein
MQRRKRKGSLLKEKKMKSLRFMRFIVLMSLSTVVFAQSDAQKSFDRLKTLAGSWVGTVDGKPMEISLRVTSMGSALIHEMTVGGRPDDPITMFHVDGDRLLMTHYCDAGNQPRFVGKMAPSGKTVEFEFLDVTNFNSASYGRMQHVALTMLDPNHHTEDWTFMVQGGKPPIVAHMDLQRTK